MIAFLLVGIQTLHQLSKQSRDNCWNLVKVYNVWLADKLNAKTVKNHDVLVYACVFVDVKFIRGLPRIKFHINKNKGVN